MDRLLSGTAAGVRRIHMRSNEAVLIFTMLCAAFHFSALSADGGINVGTLTIERDADYGETYRGTFEVSNTGSEPEAVIVFQTDYLCFSDGSNRYDAPGQLERSNADWITIRPNRIELPAGQSAEIAYEVRVPNDSTLIGTYWSMIMVEQVSALPDTSDLAGNQSRIRQVIRFGIQCVTNFGTSGVHELKFIGTQLVKTEDNGTELWIDVENTGECLAIPVTWIELYDTTGYHIDRYDGSRKRIFPGGSVRFRMNLSDLSSGHYKALVVLDSGDQEVLGARLELEF